MKNSLSYHSINDLAALEANVGANIATRQEIIVSHHSSSLLLSSLELSDTHVYGP